MKFLQDQHNSPLTKVTYPSQPKRTQLNALIKCSSPAASRGNFQLSLTLLLATAARYVYLESYQISPNILVGLIDLTSAPKPYNWISWNLITTFFKTFYFYFQQQQ